MTAIVRSACGMRRPAEVSRKMDSQLSVFVPVAPVYPAVFAGRDFKSTVSMARDIMPPEMFRALNPFCNRMRVA